MTMRREHPFARFVAALGRGPGRSRDLDQDEARDAMTMILRGEVEPTQLGAFLMLMRYKQETPAELAGFVEAARAQLNRPVSPPAVDLDWPSYADKHRQLPWFVLSALLLARNGIKVLMHGVTEATDGRATTRAALAALGIPACATLHEAAAQLDAGDFAYVPLENLSPQLGRLFGLRRFLGLRSPVNSLGRALNPVGAAHQIQGVFHPPYRGLHQEAAILLGQRRTAIFKGGGGEAQRNPDKPAVVATLDDGRAGEEEWPALTPGSGHPWRQEPMDVARIAVSWREDDLAPAPRAAVTGTAAVALKMLGKAQSMDEAQERAEAMWAARDRGAYGRAVKLSA